VSLINWGHLMKKANISSIKAELSKYLRYVKQGEEVLILDRERVVAKMVPVTATDEIRIIQPEHDLKSTIAAWKGQVFDEEADIVDLLMADREDRL